MMAIIDQRLHKVVLLSPTQQQQQRRRRQQHLQLSHDLFSENCSFNFLRSVNFYHFSSFVLTKPKSLLFLAPNICSSLKIRLKHFFKGGRRKALNGAYGARNEKLLTLLTHTRAMSCCLLTGWRGMRCIIILRDALKLFGTLGIPEHSKGTYCTI